MCLKVRLGLFGDSDGDSGGGLASKFIKSKIFKRKTKKQPRDAESTKVSKKEETKKKFNNLKIKMKSTDFLKRRAKEPTLPFTKEETIDMSILENPELKNTVVETEIVKPALRNTAVESEIEKPSLKNTAVESEIEKPSLRNTVVETEIEDESTGDHIEENSQRSVEKSAINLRKAITGSQFKIKRY